MITLKEIKRYPDTNSVEATWVDRVETPAPFIEGHDVYVPPTITEVVVKCHSYDQVQMDMLAADLGADLPEYQYIIDEVNANFIPVAPAPIIVPQSITMRQCRLQMLADGILDDVSAAVNTLGTTAKIEWEYASEIQRTNQLVPAMQMVLSWDSARVDQFFTEASEL